MYGASWEIKKISFFKCHLHKGLSNLLLVQIPVHIILQLEFNRTLKWLLNLTKKIKGIKKKITCCIPVAVHQRVEGRIVSSPSCPLAAAQTPQCRRNEELCFKWEWKINTNVCRHCSLSAALNCCYQGLEQKGVWYKRWHQQGTQSTPRGQPSSCAWRPNTVQAEM